MAISLGVVLLFGFGILVSDILRNMFFYRPRLTLYRSEVPTHLEIHVIIRSSTYSQAYKLESHFMKFLKKDESIVAAQLKIVNIRPTRPNVAIHLAIMGPDNMAMEEQNELWEAVAAYNTIAKKSFAALFGNLLYKAKIRTRSKKMLNGVQG